MGNSIPKPEVFVKALLWWLSARSGQKYTFIGRKLPIGSQRDTTSCGLFAMNAISHSIFGTDLLTHGDIRKNRLMWFNSFCKAIIQPVILFTCSIKPIKMFTIMISRTTLQRTQPPGQPIAWTLRTPTIAMETLVVLTLPGQAVARESLWVHHR